MHFVHLGIDREAWVLLHENGVGGWTTPEGKHYSSFDNIRLRVGRGVFWLRVGGRTERFRWAVTQHAAVVLIDRAGREYWGEPCSG
ncbi:MAG: hypothetical protein AAGF12_27485 [Myxococcota bacterium]